jgi:plasmid stabilization system protein ParE
MAETIIWSLLAKANPLIGKATEVKNIRYVIPHPNYSIFYRHESQRIEVLVVWDNRQNPGKLKALFPS